VDRLARGRKLGGKPIARLKNAIDADRRKARRRVSKALAKGDGDALLDELAAAVTSQGARARPPPDPNEVPRSLVRHLATSAILSRFETVMAYEVALPAAAPVLHRLRVAIKKLRYALDVFEEALPAGVQRADRVLERAQDTLGALHDHTVACEMIERFHSRKGTKKLGRLRDAEDEEAGELLRKFDVVWGELSSVEFRRQLVSASIPWPPPRSKSRVGVRRLEGDPRHSPR
jgi:CHAD domain-containing protein